MPKHRKASTSDSDSGPDDRNPPAKKAAHSSAKKEDEGWHLGNKKFIKVREFRGKVIIDVREFYEKDGDMLPGKKGIALNIEQWKKLKAVVDEVDQKISDIA